MTMNMISTTRPNIAIERTKKSRLGEIDFSNLEFGKYISDHMLVVDFLNNKWQEPKIVPFGIKMVIVAFFAHKNTLNV